MNKIKKGDSVKVITGAYKGQTGRVIKVLVNKNRLIVEGINKQEVVSIPKILKKKGFFEKLFHLFK